MIPPQFTFAFSYVCVISSTEGVMEWSTCSPEFHVDHRLCGESTCTPLCFGEFLLHDSSSIHLAFSYVCVISLTVLLRGLWSGAQNSMRIMVFVVSEPVLQYVFVNSFCMIPPPFILPSPMYVWSRRLRYWRDYGVEPRIPHGSWSLWWVNLHSSMFLQIPPAWFLLHSLFLLLRMCDLVDCVTEGIIWSDLLEVQNSTWIIVFVVSEPVPYYVFVNSSCMIPPPFTLPSPTYVWSRRLRYWWDYGVEPRIPRGSWSLFWLNLHSSRFFKIPSAWFLLHSLCLLLRMCDLIDCVTDGIMQWSPEFHEDHGLCGEWTCTPVCFCKFLPHDSPYIHFAFSYVCVISSTDGVIYLVFRIPRGSWSLWWVNLYPIMFL